MKIAKDVASRSTCLRRQHGAVLVKNDQILSTGYNGSPRGMPHCETLGCLREELNIPSGERYEMCRSIHAEANAIIQAAVNGVKIEGSTMYITGMPCQMCGRMVVNAGIVEVWIGENSGHIDVSVAEMFTRAGIEGGSIEQ